jgi:hypothetical protein
MESVPKFVVSRLQRTAPDFGSHPDFDLLTAFSERSLGEGERGRVMEHIALCNDCREVLALALPEEELSAAVVPSSSGRIPAGWVGLPAFRWAVLTAAVAVAALVGVRYSHFSHSNATAESGAIQRNAARQESAVTTPIIVSPNSQSSSSVTEGTEAEVQSSPKSPEREVRRQQAAVSKGLSSDGSSVIAMNRNPIIVPGSGNNSDFDVVKAKDPVPSEAGSGIPIFSPNIPLQTSPAMMLRASPKWTVNASGNLQRSFDGGKSWETVVPMQIVPRQASMGSASPASGSADNSSEPAKSEPASTEPVVSKPAESLVFHAVCGIGSEVWAGGVAGVLYHSTDGGHEWIRVTPSDKGVGLTGDINGVEFLDPQHGKISTSSAEVWSTSDGAHSWQKQQ